LTPPPPEDAWYVDALAVASWARGAGVARALLDDAAAQARAAGLPSVALDTTLDNAPARALYEAAGFAEAGTRDGGDAAFARIGARGLVAYVRAV
jgi:ribosomal protein S18 acetylase RimI-like enzyme